MHIVGKLIFQKIYFWKAKELVLGMIFIDHYFKVKKLNFEILFWNNGKSIIVFTMFGIKGKIISNKLCFLLVYSYEINAYKVI